MGHAVSRLAKREEGGGQAVLCSHTPEAPHPSPPSPPMVCHAPHPVYRSPHTPHTDPPHIMPPIPSRSSFLTPPVSHARSPSPSRRWFRPAFPAAAWRVTGACASLS